VFFVKKWKWVFFVKKVENGEVFFCKKVDLFQRRVRYVQYQYFFILHFTYLGVRTRPTHPLLTGLGLCKIVRNT